MKRRHLSNSYSIDYIIKILMIILLPIVLLDSMISIYVIHSMRKCSCAVKYHKKTLSN